MNSTILVYFVVVLFIPFVFVIVLSSYKRIAFRYQVGIFLSTLLFITMILPLISNVFSFDLVYGGDGLHGVSASKSEAKRRGTFICDVELVNNPLLIRDTLLVEVKDAFIEKDWVSGYWYWTTNRGNDRFNLVGHIIKKRGTWNLSRPINEEYLYFDDSHELFRSKLTRFPQPDTLNYFVLKSKCFGFTNSDIIDTISFVLKSPRGNH